MCPRYFLAACLVAAISWVDVRAAPAQDVVKIGVVIPMTGGLASVGRKLPLVLSYLSSSTARQ